MWLELGRTILRKKSQLLVCFSSSLGILIVYVKKKGRKKESLVEVFKKIKIRKFFNLLSCYVCVRKNIIALPFVLFLLVVLLFWL